MPQPAKRYSRPNPPAGSRRADRVSWDQAVELFLAEGRRMNLSTATLQNYRAYLCGPRVRAYLSDRGLVGPADLTAEALRDLERELVGVELKPGTVATYHRVLKNFAGFCIREGIGASEEVLLVAGPKLPQVEPDSFTDAEIARLFVALKSRPRDEILIRFMLQTGLRLQEVCNTTVDDVIESPDGWYVRVRQGKGRKDRIVPLDTPQERLSARLRRYVDRIRPRQTRSRALFLSARKLNGEYGPLTRHGVQVLCQRLTEEIGIHVNAHKFRHSFATRALAAGVDVMALQRALGHSTLAMVSRYVHYQRDDLLRAWQTRRD